MSPSKHQTAISSPTKGAPTGETRPLLIAGAGIAGLSCALALARHGFASEVFEKRSTFEPEGAGIQIGPNGARVLRQLQLDDRLEELSGRPEAVVVRDVEGGRSIIELPLTKAGNAPADVDYLTLHRRDLHQALVAKAEQSPLITVHMGKPVIQASQDATVVQINIDDDIQHHGQLLVIADGVQSDLRHAYFSAAPLKPIGKAAIRTVIPAHNLPQAFNIKTTGLWLGQNLHAVHYPITGGREIALVVVISDDTVYRGWSNDVSLNWLLSRIGHVTDDLQDLLQLGKTWRAWTLYSGGTPTTTANNRLVLVGDAAHPTLPFLAQGGVMGLEDAVVLADAFARTPNDITGALLNYAGTRRPRTQRLTAASSRNGRIYHLTGLQAAARNTTMRLLGGKALMHQYDWLYNWQPPEMPK